MSVESFHTDEAAMDAWSAAYARLHREGLAEFPPACLYYVLELVRHVSRTDGPPDPAALIAAFRAATRRDFGPLRDDVLADWALTRPADLGRAVALLGHVGCLVLEAGDDPARYAADPRPFAPDDEDTTEREALATAQPEATP